MDYPVTALFAHLILFTDELLPLLKREYEEGLRSRLDEILDRQGCQLIVIGGTDNHLHVLTTFTVDTLFDDLVRILQQKSAEWIRGTWGDTEFCWSSEYYCLSVHYTEVGTLTAYIDEQRAYHRDVTLEQELQEIREAAEDPPKKPPFDPYRN